MDGKGPLPDSNQEVVAWIGIGVAVFLAFGFFTGLDAQAEYVVSAPSKYFSLSSTSSGDGVVFSSDQVDLMNEVSSRSLGSDAIAAERLYCGEINNGQVDNFRLADIISDSSLTMVSGSCFGEIDLWLHSQPDGSQELSEEDKDLESTGASYTCIQYAEISSSPLNNRLNGVNCWKILGEGTGFEPVPVFIS